MAEQGKIPRRLRHLKNRPPFCASCAFGKARKRPRLTKKSSNSSSIRKPEHNIPGKCVSVDHLVSAQPGFIPQMSGHLTNMRIWAASVFVDHFTDYVFVHLMRDLTIDETLIAKAAFERMMHNKGHKVQGYRGDNGLFGDKGFRDSCDAMVQELTFCVVSDHHQNNVVERRIQELTLLARTMLLHAKRHWPDMITTMLWPFALKCAADRLNKFSQNKDGFSPEELLCNMRYDINVGDRHTFGCPVFVLDHRLQGGPGGPPKWDPRACVGIYLGRSPFHANNVALVLNPRTGHISPQYHVVFDDDFTTVPFMSSGTVPPN